MSAGRRSIIPFQTARAASYGLVDRAGRPRRSKRSRNARSRGLSMWRTAWSTMGALAAFDVEARVSVASRLRVNLWRAAAGRPGDLDCGGWMSGRDGDVGGLGGPRRAGDRAGRSSTVRRHAEAWSRRRSRGSRLTDAIPSGVGHCRRRRRAGPGPRAGCGHGVRPGHRAAPRRAGRGQGHHRRGRPADHMRRGAFAHRHRTTRPSSRGCARRVRSSSARPSRPSSPTRTRRRR